jgi:serine/threonine protein kinase
MIGQTFSHYKVTEKLGQGGMGVIYKAQDLKLDRFVALKFLPPHLTSSEEEKQRFIHEAKAASSLDHNNICNIYEIDETEDGQMFISMAYYEGETLDKQIKEKPLPVEEAINIAIQIAQGLAKAHEKKVVHRDIKPANIMLTREGVVKVLDFGLAKISTQTKLTKESATLGTVSYMSPEQAKGEEVTSRTDIWSLGVVLYEMLTGQLPFKGEYDSAVIFSIMNDTQESVTGVRTGVPLELERIINKCLNKYPGDRYQHIEELIVDLQNLKKDSDSKVDAAKISKREQIEPQRINRFIKPGIAILVTMVVAFIYFTMVQKAESRAQIPIAVVDFVNETGEDELSSLSGMLTTALEQSKRLSVVTRSRMFDILKQLNKENIDYIDENLGREIANQVGIKVLVLASVQKFDQLYNVDLKIIDPIEDKYLFAASEKERGKENIPIMIDRLAEKTREGLEESAEDIQLNTVPIAQITTTNLEAYQHYFKGQEYTDKMMFEDAKSEFDRAIELDSTFGLAYYGLAYALDWEQNEEQAGVEIDKAFKYIDQIPDKEKYLVRFVKTTVDSGWGEAGLKILRDMEKVYPDEKEMIYNIGDISWHIGELDTAKKYLEKVLKIDPSSARTLLHLTWIYRDLKEYNRMLKTAKQYASISNSVEAFIPLAEAHSLLATAYFETGEYDKIEHEIDEEYKILREQFKRKATSNEAYWSLHLFYVKRGLDKLAIKILNNFIISDSLRNSRAISQRGFVYFFTGEFKKSEADFRSVLDINPDNSTALYGLSLVLVAVKRCEDAGKIRTQIDNTYPERNRAIIDALLYACKGEKEKAFETYEDITGDVHAILGMKDEAIRLLAKFSEQQIKCKRSYYYGLKTSRFYDNIRSDPRFQEILAKHKEIYEENLEKYGDIDI